MISDCVYLISVKGMSIKVLYRINIEFWNIIGSVSVVWYMRLNIIVLMSCVMEIIML